LKVVSDPSYILSEYILTHGVSEVLAAGVFGAAPFLIGAEVEYFGYVVQYQFS
jgi:hypothetical protein